MFRLSTCVCVRLLMKRKLAKYGAGDDATVDIRAELTGAARGTKASITGVLSILKGKGHLVDDRLGDTRERWLLQDASEKHGKADTPFGTVIQRLHLTDDYGLEYVQPCVW